MQNLSKELQPLIQAAREENWDTVTKLLTELADNEETIRWALEEGIQDTDGNIRDLAVSTFEVNKYTLKEEELEKIRNVMLHDENIYAQFRAAFALFVRGDRSDEVMEKMQAATHDADVKEIAENYLKEK